LFTLGGLFLKTVRRNHSSVSVWSVFLFFLISSGGCSTLEESRKDSPPLPEPINLAHPFTDIPIPKGFDRDQSKSFVYESGKKNIKVGRLFFSGSSNLKEMVEFYQNEMINHKWTPGVSFLANNGKILNYQKTGWDCTVIIQSGWLGSDIEIQIGPK